MYIKFNFARIKLCVVVVYGPRKDDDGEVERFWNGSDWIWTEERVGNGYR